MVKNLICNIQNCPTSSNSGGWWKVLQILYREVLLWQWRIQGRGPGGPPPLIFQPKCGPKGQRKFFWRPGTSFPHAYLRVWIRHCTMSNPLPFLFTIVDRKVCIPCLLTNGTPFTYGTYNHWYHSSYKNGSWTIVLGHFCISGVFSNSQRSNASPHPTNNVERVYPEFLLSFKFV